MGSIFATSVGLRRILLLVFVLAALLVWAPVAQAQTPTDVQYGPPTGDPPARSAAGAAPSGGAGGGGAGGGAGSGGVALLPTTGGPLLLPLVGLGAVALGATGVFALRRFGRYDR